MNVSAYIVKFLKNHNVKHFFGYQGTMIAYFVDAIVGEEGVYNHVSYNEQGAALAACGFAKESGWVSVAYATSGPGALNLIQGVADAYYDSVPVIFITGQLNTNEYTENKELRQQGFQQSDIINIFKPITKKTFFVSCPTMIEDVMNEAWEIATTGRKGPVVIDLPMNIQRSEVSYEETKVSSFLCSTKEGTQIDEAVQLIKSEIEKSERPLFLLGNGLGKERKARVNVRKLIEKYQIPVVTTMLGKDVIPNDSLYNFGYIGSAYGHRYANLISNIKTDLIISLGSRLCPRQIGMNADRFATNAKVIRIDIDKAELSQKIHPSDVCVNADANLIVDRLLDETINKDFSDWLKKCTYIKNRLECVDAQEDYYEPNRIVENISRMIPDYSTITCDVGQHQIWVAQSFLVKDNQRLLFSGGHGAMGFSVPAAIGAFYSTGNKVFCIAGDGSMQMNIQELQWVVRDNIPIKMIIMNNGSLGLIRQQQDSIFDGRYGGSTVWGGYSSPCFAEIASAYGISSLKVEHEKILSGEVEDDLRKALENDKPMLIEVLIDVESKALPKTSFGQDIHNQQPYISSELMSELTNI